VNVAKTTSERVSAMRRVREELGLKRLELYAHPGDWPAIKQLAIKMQMRRAKKAGRPTSRLTFDMSRKPGSRERLRNAE
jgi:hypothetical protein